MPASGGRLTGFIQKSKVQTIKAVRKRYARTKKVEEFGRRALQFGLEPSRTLSGKQAE